jgi:putative transposase
MHEWQSICRMRWDCRYHVVIIPKSRKRKLYGKVRKHVGEVLREVCEQRVIGVLEAHLMQSHIHMRLSVAPKQSVAFAIRFIKGKSAVRIHRQILGNNRVTGLHFWSRGYCVRKVGLDEETIWKYIREQEALEKHQGEVDFDN